MNFDEWFSLQMGSRPGRNDVSDGELHDRATRGAEAAALLARRKRWDAQYTAACRAWNAREIEVNDLAGLGRLTPTTPMMTVVDSIPEAAP